MFSKQLYGKSQSKGFTLIELLVVISIIALLLSILMPTLSKARHTAKRLVCQTNQRGLAQAYILYASDNDGQVIIIESSFPYYMTNRSGFAPGFIENRHRFAPYITPELFYCPAMGNALGGVQGPDDPGGGWSSRPIHEVGDYYIIVGYNMLAGWGSSVSGNLKYLPYATRGNLDSQAASPSVFPDRFSKTRSAATTPLLTDITFTPWPPDGLDYIVENYTWAPFGDYSLPDSNFALNHVFAGNRVLGTNTAFADGHVEWSNEDEIFPRAWYTFGQYFF